MFEQLRVQIEVLERRVDVTASLPQLLQTP